MRTFFVTNKPIHPVIGGAAIRNWQNINLLMARGPVGTFSVVSYPTNWGERPPGVAFWRQYRPARNTLWRTLERKLWWLRLRGHNWADQFYHTSIEQDLTRALAEFKPDLIVMEELWLHRYLPALKRHGCPVVFDAHNVEALLSREIHASTRGFGARNNTRLLAAKVGAIERRVVQAADQIWVCSEAEVNPMRRLYGRRLRIQVVPNGIDTRHYQDEAAAATPPDLARSRDVFPTLIFTASFAYQPNVVAAQLLIDEIYPRIKQRFAGCRLLLVGNQPTAAMLEAARRDAGIVVTGRVPDVRPYLAAAEVVVVPLLQGGGTRLKLLESFAARRPVVSTTKGAEGLATIDGAHLLIRDDLAQLAAAVEQLASDRAMSARLVENAFQFVQENYSWEAHAPKIDAALNELVPPAAACAVA